MSDVVKSSSKSRSLTSTPSSPLLGRPVFWIGSSTAIAAIIAGMTIFVDALPNQAADKAFYEASAAVIAPAAVIDTEPQATAPLNTTAPASVAATLPARPAEIVLPAPTIAEDSLAAPEGSFAAEHLSDESGNYGFTVTADQEARYTSVNQNADYPSLETRMLEMQARRGGKIFNPEDVLAAISSPTPWETNDASAETLDLTPEQKLDGREFVAVNQLKIESLVPGDTLELPVAFEDGSIEMKVESVEVGDSGEVTWNGRIADFEEENQVSITQGTRVTAGEITTPNGNYLIESRAEAGWIVPATTLYQPTDEDDRIYPEETTNS